MSAPHFMAFHPAILSMKQRQTKKPPRQNKDKQTKKDELMNEKSEIFYTAGMAKILGRKAGMKEILTEIKKTTKKRKKKLRTRGKKDERKIKRKDKECGRTQKS